MDTRFAADARDTVIDAGDWADHLLEQDASEPCAKRGCGHMAANHTRDWCHACAETPVGENYGDAARLYHCAHVYLPPNLAMPYEAVTPQLELFRAAVTRFRDAGQLDGVTPFGWFLAGMGALAEEAGTVSAAQIVRLANFIMEEVPGEPSQSEGAVDVAIRWMRSRLEYEQKLYETATDGGPNPDYDEASDPLAGKYRTAINDQTTIGFSG